MPVAVCSAATKSAVEFVLGSLLGQERFAGLDLFMAGDDVKEKKPDPTIYKVCLFRTAWCCVVRDMVLLLGSSLQLTLFDCGHVCVGSSNSCCTRR